MARAKRELLLRAHRYRLRRDDLEDCYSQATLELLAQARAGGRFADRSHLANILELRFLSRVRDLQRARSGRSPMLAALEAAISLGGAGEREVNLADRHAELETLVILREELRRVRRLALGLTPDQRLVLASQLRMTPRREFCDRHGWSAEKYRKVAQRARSRLRQLMAVDESLSH